MEIRTDSTFEVARCFLDAFLFVSFSFSVSYLYIYCSSTNKKNSWKSEFRSFSERVHTVNKSLFSCILFSELERNETRGGRRGKGLSTSVNVFHEMKWEKKEEDVQNKGISDDYKNRERGNLAGYPSTWSGGTRFHPCKDSHLSKGNQRTIHTKWGEYIEKRGKNKGERRKSRAPKKHQRMRRSSQPEGNRKHTVKFLSTHPTIDWRDFLSE